MKTKKIKVAYSTRYQQSGSQIVPKIQMEGKWLEALGFSISSTIIVEYEEGSIRIRPINEEEMLYSKQTQLEQELHNKKMELNRLQAEYTHLTHVAEEMPHYNK